METREKVIEIRQAFGIGAEELANLAGIIRQSVYKWQTGETVPRHRAQSRIKQLHKAAKAWEETGLAGSRVLTHHQLTGEYVSLYQILKQPLIDHKAMADAAVELAQVPTEVAIPKITKSDSKMNFKVGHEYHGFLILDCVPARLLRDTQYKTMHIVKCGHIKWVSHGHMTRRKLDGAYEMCNACFSRKRYERAVILKSTFEEIPKDIGPVIGYRPLNRVCGNIARTELALA